MGGPFWRTFVSPNARTGIRQQSRQQEKIIQAGKIIKIVYHQHTHCLNSVIGFVQVMNLYFHFHWWQLVHFCHGSKFSNVRDTWWVKRSPKEKAGAVKQKRLVVLIGTFRPVSINQAYKGLEAHSITSGPSGMTDTTGGMSLKVLLPIFSLRNSFRKQRWSTCFENKHPPSSFLYKMGVHNPTWSIGRGINKLCSKPISIALVDFVYQLY